MKKETKMYPIVDPYLPHKNESCFHNHENTQEIQNLRCISLKSALKTSLEDL